MNRKEKVYGGDRRCYFWNGFNYSYGNCFFVLYVYGKLILIKIGLIDAEEVDESKKENESDGSMWIE